LELHWTGGLRVEPPAVHLEPGQKSEGLRVLDFRYQGDTWILELEGVSGRNYEMRLHGEPFSRVVGAALFHRHESVSTLSVPFPSGRGRSNVQVRIQR
jgi:hypothetical protein